MSRRSRYPQEKLAYEDPRFMESLVARPLRILAEYMDPLNRLRLANVSDTIVMFGSARIQSRGRALERLKEVRRNARGRRTLLWRQKVSAARSLVSMSRYYEEARELAHRLTTWSMTLGDKPRRFVVCSGGGPGIMEAANSRRRRSRWPFDRPQHPASARTGLEPVHHAQSEFPLSLFFYAQALVRADGQGVDYFSGRVWHHGRTLGNAHADANQQALPTSPDSDLRKAILGQGGQLASHGPHRRH